MAKSSEVKLTKEMVQERLDTLIKERDTLRTTLITYEGAIQDCQYWLEKFND